MVETGEAQYEGSVDKHLERLIEWRNRAISAMFDVRSNKERNITIETASGEDKALQTLRTYLDMLLLNYWPKRNYSDSFDLDEDLAEKIEKGDGPEPNSQGLDFEECRELLYKLIELMEQIGHTKYESDKNGRRTID